MYFKSLKMTNRVMAANLRDLLSLVDLMSEELEQLSHMEKCVKNEILLELRLKENLMPGNDF